MLNANLYSTIIVEESDIRCSLYFRVLKIQPT